LPEDKRRAGRTLSDDGQCNPGSLLSCCFKRRKQVGFTIEWPESRNRGRPMFGDELCQEVVNGGIQGVSIRFIKLPPPCPQFIT
jgi:hypothetical protein